MGSQMTNQINAHRMIQSHNNIFYKASSLNQFQTVHLYIPTFTHGMHTIYEWVNEMGIQMT